jgi:hypothetical protein
VSGVTATMTLSKKKSRGALIVLVLVAALLAFGQVIKPRPIQFKTLKQFRDFAVAHGLLFHRFDTPSPDLAWGSGDAASFFVSDHPVAIDDLLQLTTRNCGLIPAWKGILLVHFQHAEMYISPTSIGGKWRLWGNLLVAGDEQLMDRVERLYRAG